MNSEGSDAAKRRGAGSPRGETLIRRPTGGNDYVDGERTMLVTGEETTGANYRALLFAIGSSSHQLWDNYESMKRKGG